MATTKQRKRSSASKRKMQEASRKIDELAKKLGKWDPHRIVRKFRDSNLSEKS
jgi:membrane protein insertase Oxa1/YidC/SpoIIIJ